MKSWAQIGSDSSDFWKLKQQLVVNVYGDQLHEERQV
jgi:hypothetical protein